MDYYTNGTTYGISADGTLWIKSDYCDVNTFIEYDCDGTKPGSGASLLCSNGCKDGACILNQTTNSQQQEQVLKVGENTFFDNGWSSIGCL